MKQKNKLLGGECDELEEQLEAAEANNKILEDENKKLKEQIKALKKGNKVLENEAIEGAEID